MIKQFLTIFIFYTLCPFASIGADDVTTATFKLYWKGLVIGEAGVELKMNASDYSIYSSFETKGVLRLFVKGKSELNASGDIRADGSSLSKSLKTEGLWRGDRYAREIIFDENGRVTKLDIIDPEDDEDDDDYILLPVPKDQQRGPDPTSILIDLMKAPWEKNEDGIITHTSFNGTQVSQATLTCDKISQDLPKRKNRAYQGKAVYCTITMKVIAGGWQEKPNNKKRKKRSKRKARDKKPMTVWLADVAGDGKYIPVEFSLPSNWGRTVFTMTAHKSTIDAGKALTAAK